jgi:hypothetical protein
MYLKNDIPRCRRRALHGAQGNQEAGEARRRTARSLTGAIFAMRKSPNRYP